MGSTVIIWTRIQGRELEIDSPERFGKIFCLKLPPSRWKQQILPKRCTYLQRYMASRLIRQLSLWPMNCLDCSLTVIKPCSLVGGYQSFTGSWSLPFQDRISFFGVKDSISEPWHSAVKIRGLSEESYSGIFVITSVAWSLISWRRE